HARALASRRNLHPLSWLRIGSARKICRGVVDLRCAVRANLRRKWRPLLSRAYPHLTWPQTAEAINAAIVGKRALLLVSADFEPHHHAFHRLAIRIEHTSGDRARGSQVELHAVFLVARVLQFERVRTTSRREVDESYSIGGDHVTALEHGRDGELSLRVRQCAEDLLRIATADR